MTQLELVEDTSLHIVIFGIERYWNRRRLRHCFDVLSIFALFAAEIVAFFLHSAPDYLLRTVLAQLSLQFWKVFYSLEHFCGLGRGVYQQV